METLAPEFNWVLLVLLVVVVLVSIFFLFYFNRAFGRFFTYLLRLYIRFAKLDVYVDIQSVQVSLLAGRIFFGKITYHGTNQSIIALNSHITWRYWFRHVRKSLQSEVVGGSLPCRIRVHVQGLEWFIYNRSPAYDNIIAEMTKEESDAEGANFNYSSGGGHPEDDNLSTVRSKDMGSTVQGTIVSKTRSDRGREEERQKFTTGDRIYLEALPIEFKIDKGAVVMGNANTPTVMVAQFQRGFGTYKASMPRSTADKYKTELNCRVRNMIIDFRDNEEYIEGQAEMGRKVYEAVKAEQRGTGGGGTWDFLSNFAPRLGDLFLQPEPPQRQKSTSIDGERWMGLSRYIDDGSGSDSIYEPAEYAKIPRILEAPEAEMSYFWDVVGPVGPDDNNGEASTVNLNGSLPPEFGLDLSISDAKVHYGPWADRQRFILQSIFFPRVFKNNKPRGKLKIGEDRVYTTFKTFIELHGETVVQIPTKEPSKDWKIQKAQERDTRPPGWLGLRIADNSTISYSMGMVPLEDHWDNKLVVELNKPEVRSSVNHGLLYKATSQTIVADLSAPLEWKSQHTWKFNIENQAINLFVIREHVILVTDLISDWGAGPPPEYATFTPYIYEIELNLRHFLLYLNVNDGNIIDDPSDLEQNTYLLIKGPLLGVSVTIPLDRYIPAYNEIPFNLQIPKATMELQAPPWNTQASFLDSKMLAKVNKVGLKGSYHYASSTGPTLVDTLSIDLPAHDLVLRVEGSLIRYLLNFQKNYFGELIHFKTLDEHNEDVKAAKRAAENPPPQISNENSPPKSNDIDVIVQGSVKNMTLILPANLYSDKSNITAQFSTLSVDMRFTNYYMDLQVNLSPLSASLGRHIPGHEFGSTPSAPQAFINGLSIYGHRLFGLPPTEPTYVCCWDISLGSITGECSSDFTRALISAAKALDFGVDDFENALPLDGPSVVHDATFLRVKIDSTRVWLHVESAVFLAEAGQLDLKLNDLADLFFSERISVKLPGLRIACFDEDSVQGAQFRDSRAAPPIASHACMSTDLDISIFNSVKGLKEKRRLQQQHLRVSDQPTNRAIFLLQGGASRESSLYNDITDLQPTLPLPALPAPATRGTIQQYLDLGESISDSSSHRTRSSARRGAASSFRSSGYNRRRSALKSDSEPSFHSALMSQELEPPETPLRSKSATNMAFITPPQIPSTRQNVNHRPIDLRRYSSAGVLFSSSYVRPRFPLDSVQPNTADMPPPPTVYTKPASPADFPFSAAEPSEHEDNQMTIVLEAKNGIQAFCDPFTILAAGKLLHALQAQTVEDLLDELQITILTRIAKLVKKKKLKAEQKTMNFCVKIPFFTFRLINRPMTSLKEDDQKTFIDLNITDIDLAFQSRGKRFTDLPDKEKSIISCHAMVGLVELAIQDSDAKSHAASVSVEDILFWASTCHAATASLEIQSLRGHLKSSDIIHFIEMAENMEPVIDEIATLFGTASKGEKERLRRLIYTLAVGSEEMHLSHDPSALTKPSIVLRSTPDHVRVNDSWKMLGRVRHIYRSMHPNKQKQIDRSLRDDSVTIPSDAKRAVILAFEAWRSWEMAEVGESRFIRNVFGKDKKLAKETTKEQDVAISLKSAVFTIDPGPSQQEFAMYGLAVSATIADRKPGNVTPLVPLPDILVQVYCQTAGVALSWEVLDVVQDLARYFSTKPKKTPQPKPVKPAPMTHIVVPKQKLWHFILSSDDCSLRLSTVNLKLVGLLTDPRVSVLVSNISPSMANANLANALWEAAGGSIELVHANKLLATLRMKQSSIFVNSEIQKPSETMPYTRNHLKAIVNCNDLSLDIREQILGLMEALDIFVCDEMAQVRGLIQTFSKAGDHEKKKSTSTAKHHRKKKEQLFLNTAISLENFSFCAALLPSLAYIVRGGGIRLATRQKSPDEMVFDFDLLHHEHEIRTAERSSTRSISLLQMPEINARLRHRESRYERLVEAFVSVETIELEVSAMQSLLNALNKPEVVNVIEDVKSEWVRTKQHIDKLAGMPTPAPKAVEKPSGPTLVYRAHVGVAGLRIQTKAPNAKLEIKLGSIQGRATNKPDGSSTVIDMPEASIDIQRITVELTRRGLSLDDDRCGYIELQASLRASSKAIEDGRTVRVFSITSRGVKIDLYAATASTIVDVAGHLQDKLRDLDLSKEVKHLRKLRRSKSTMHFENSSDDGLDLFQSIYTVDIQAIQLSWIVGNAVPCPLRGIRQNLVLSIKRINLATDIRNQNEARLAIEEFILQMVDENSRVKGRTDNSALLPNINFAVLYSVSEKERQLKFDARGESVDLRLTSSCAIGMSHLQASIAKASDQFRKASENWKSTPTESGEERKNLFGSKRFSSIMVDADFAGAVVRIQGSQESTVLSHGIKMPQASRYGQFASGDSSNSTVMRSPGLAFKVEYSDPGTEDPSLNGEIKISASTNALYPSIVPLVLEMSENVKNVVKIDANESLGVAVRDDTSSVRSFLEEHEDTKDTATAILGKCRLNLGLRICQQQFSLSCQPIARVEATARYEDIYITVNTCEDPETGRFYALSGTGRGLECSLRHVYSREETAQIKVDQIDISLMNSKYLSGSSGISVITKTSPIEATLNVKQIQDFLLFKEIWLPEELRTTPPTPATTPAPHTDTPTQLVKRYHKVAAAEAFPWNTTVSVERIGLKIEFGPALGTTQFSLLSFWLSSRKTSDWEQTMYLGFDKISVTSDGRLSGHVELTDLHARTSIRWHSAEEVAQTPLVEAALGFGGFKSKVAFEYQPFLVADVANFEFLMYNLRQGTTLSSDQLVGILDGEKVNIFATALSASQGLALWQAIEKLKDDKRASFETALREVEKYLIRAQRSASASPLPTSIDEHDISFPHAKLPKEEPDSLSLRINVVVNLKEVNLGAFPNTFQDQQIFKLEAADIGARFAVEMEKNKLHSQLSMTLGQLRIALSAVRRAATGNSLADISVQEVVLAATGSRGGTILKVPHVSAAMHTWHVGGSNEIDFTFKSAFEGKVDVGWNYTRIQFIRNMWTRNLKALSERQGKPLAATPAISINATNLRPTTPTSLFDSPHSSEPDLPTDRPRSFSSTKSHLSESATTTTAAEGSSDQPKITAVVNVPQSRYTYRPLVPPIIETPQLRDMGEATPPLEWIGFNRERLPNLTHQIVIVSLLEIAREVEDAYFKILGG